MAIVLSNNLQSISADTGFCAAFKIKLNLIIFKGLPGPIHIPVDIGPPMHLHQVLCMCMWCAAARGRPFAWRPHERVGALAGHTAGFVHEDLLEVVEPAAHAKMKPCSAFRTPVSLA